MNGSDRIPFLCDPESGVIDTLECAFLSDFLKALKESNRDFAHAAPGLGVAKHREIRRSLLEFDQQIEPQYTASIKAERRKQS